MLDPLFTFLSHDLRFMLEFICQIVYFVMLLLIQLFIVRTDFRVWSGNYVLKYNHLSLTQNLWECSFIRSVKILLQKLIVCISCHEKKLWQPNSMKVSLC